MQCLKDMSTCKDSHACKDLTTNPLQFHSLEKSAQGGGREGRGVGQHLSPRLLSKSVMSPYIRWSPFRSWIQFNIWLVALSGKHGPADWKFTNLLEQLFAKLVSTLPAWAETAAASQSLRCRWCSWREARAGCILHIPEPFLQPTSRLLLQGACTPLQPLQGGGRAWTWWWRRVQEEGLILPPPLPQHALAWAWKKHASSAMSKTYRKSLVTTQNRHFPQWHKSFLRHTPMVSSIQFGVSGPCLGLSAFLSPNRTSSSNNKVLWSFLRFRLGTSRLELPKCWFTHPFHQDLLSSY